MKLVASMKLSFMTFVCPEWKIEKIVRFAGEAGYEGVEIRVDEGHKHGVSSKSSQEERRYVKRLFDGEGIEVSCIATSVQFGFPDPNMREGNIEVVKANVRLAGDLGAKVVRIFAGGGIPKLSEEASSYIAEAFTEIGDYAVDYGVCPMLESGHDIIKSAVEAVEVINRVKTLNFGVLWNDSDMDQQTFELLKNHVRHFHIHDEVLDPKNRNILHLARLMKSINFDGYISLEIIKGYNLPEDLLIETAKRLKGYIAQA